MSFKTVATSGPSTVQVAESPSTRFLSVKFTLGPCTALQPHVHNGSELAQVITGSVNVGIINEKSELVKEVMSPGTLSQVPVGKIHYYYNPSCDSVVFTGAFDYGTTTQFILQSLSLIPAEALAFLTVGPLPKLISQNPPFATDPKCLEKCGSAGTQGGPGLFGGSGGGRRL